ncbi:hypothetical protein M2459_001175 [Parabacteroides sp. PF5-5]|uniref:hypothetical protein n=1 Tax=unclassified Parabacteroides TaxID=2649774 RepID=UPI002472FEFB|nr:MULTISPECIES: hypothetical protein [unclassified Parabacteroides]MDH6304442.1 hypothetical protein [Parabacteroides sp. PH5-39]MDH6315405.1 hypothetical protein [Parabacteroides sp. PF5-13]MDH6319101.1 hypothetical protein [Parabacteroides sp. PH5-13]MDH6322831.1 hypothetical protein [Parabacteroides sp. PH5-8]MDH6326597.1 hypothetical protein [Parabacteroides sp. PH5-41]
MNSSIFKLFFVLLFFSVSTAKAQETTNEKKDIYQRRVEKQMKFWQALTPKYTKLQFAGSIGLLSGGIGWNYGKEHWETDLLLGIVPRNADRHAMVTLTLKQNYIPWRLFLREKVSFEPLTCGLYTNTLLDGDFWVNNPDKYPNKYYTFSTKVRFHAFLGERLTLQLNPEKWPFKSVTFFYEFSTCDLYLISAINNNILKPKDYLSLSFGIKLQVL